MTDLSQLRSEIDRIDTQLFELFSQRVDVARRIGDYKRERGLAVSDHNPRAPEGGRRRRPRAPELSTYAQVLMELLMETARSQEVDPAAPADADFEPIERAVEQTPAVFPSTAQVACQGVEGAYSQIAADRLFRHPVHQLPSTASRGSSAPSSRASASTASCPSRTPRPAQSTRSTTS